MSALPPARVRRAGVARRGGFLRLYRVTGMAALIAARRVVHHDYHAPSVARIAFAARRLAARTVVNTCVSRVCCDAMRRRKSGHEGRTPRSSPARMCADRSRQRRGRSKQVAAKHRIAKPRAPEPARGTPTRPPGQIVLVLQGGGALGAYQVGVYQAMHEAGIEPDWVIGTSIGAINAALIAGNAPRTPARATARVLGVGRVARTARLRRGAAVVGRQSLLEPADDRLRRAGFLRAQREGRARRVRAARRRRRVVLRRRARCATPSRGASTSSASTAACHAPHGGRGERAHRRDALLRQHAISCSGPST